MPFAGSTSWGGGDIWPCMAYTGKSHWTGMVFGLIVLNSANFPCQKAWLIEKLAILDWRRLPFVQQESVYFVICSKQGPKSAGVVLHTGVVFWGFSSLQGLAAPLYPNMDQVPPPPARPGHLPRGPMSRISPVQMHKQRCFYLKLAEQS